MEPLLRPTMTTNDPNATRNDFYDTGAAVRMVCMGAVHRYNGERAGEGGSAPLRACAMAIKLLGCFGISRTL